MIRKYFGSHLTCIIRRLKFKSSETFSLTKHVTFDSLKSVKIRSIKWEWLLPITYHQTLFQSVSQKLIEWKFVSMRFCSYQGGIQNKISGTFISYKFSKHVFKSLNNLTRKFKTFPKWINLFWKINWIFKCLFKKLNFFLKVIRLSEQFWDIICYHLFSLNSTKAHGKKFEFGLSSIVLVL